MKFAIKTIHYFIITALLFNLSACVTTETRTNSYRIKGKIYTPLKSAKGYQARGLASFYSKHLHNRKTANGERYNMNSMTAAHPTLPFNTRVRVKNVTNGRTAVVRINDRGPFYSRRIIDLSHTAARQLGITSPAMVEIQALN